MEQLDPKRIQDAMRMANSPAGQQLIRHLRQTGGEDLNHALNQASAGDYTKAMQLLSQMAKSPDLQKYLKQLRREENG